MRRLTAAFAALALLGACGNAGDESPAAASTEAAMATPDLAACPTSELADNEYRERKQPIPVPAEFAGLVASSMDQFAVSTASGGTVCVDTGWMETIDGAKVSPDRRFLAFEWGGYEAFGYIVVDRSGTGQVIETGTAPLSPPTGMRFASIDLSESGFGEFNAFGVWQIEPVGLRELARIDEGFPPGDWRIEGWSGEDCVNLSLLPIDRQPDDAGDFSNAPRDAWFAAAGNGWKPAPGACPKA